MATLTLTGDTDADRLLSDNAFALLVGMLLDQQISMELAFVGPHRLEARIEGPLTPTTLSAMDPDDLEAVFRQKPALHRYPGSMATRVQTLARHLVDEYDGDASAVWADVPSGRELLRRLQALPGFGEQKARIFLALLAKQCGVAPDGWREAAGDYGLDGHRSIADVTSPGDLERVRAFKQAAKAAGRRG